MHFILAIAISFNGLFAPPKPPPEIVHVESTAYTAHCLGCSGITATGIDLFEHPLKKVIAVDPSIIPLGSSVYVPGYGYAVAGDTGGAIKGHRIDIYMRDLSDALDWGRRDIDVVILD